MEVHVRMQGIREAFELSALCAACGGDLEVIECYETAILARFEAKPNYEVPPERIHHFLWDAIKNMYDKMFEMERHAFLSGYYKAFALYAVPCAYCDPCIPEKEGNVDFAVKRFADFSTKPVHPWRRLA